MASEPNGHEYNITIADGHSLHLRASEEIRPWLAEMARIMELSGGTRKGPGNVYFLRSKFPSQWDELRSENGEIPADLPVDGWKYYKSIIEVWYNEKSSDFVINLGPNYIRQEPKGAKGQFDEYDYTLMSLSMFSFFKHSVDLGGIPFHAGQVARDGKAVLLAATGGTGKSTCCRRIALPWKAVSDDEVLIMPDGADSYHIHPFPTWSDYIYQRNRLSWKADSHLPLSAIFFIKQAAIDKAIPLNKVMAAGHLYRSSLQAYSRCLAGMDIPSIRILRNMVFENVSAMAKTIPAYSLDVNLNGRFWEEIERVMPEFKH